MIARTRPQRGLLCVAFARDGEAPEIVQAIDGARAAANAITMIAARLVLQPGDHISCYRASDEPEPDYPEPSRSSHVSG